MGRFSLLPAIIDVWKQYASSKAQAVTVCCLGEDWERTGVLGEENDRRIATPGHEQVGSTSKSLNDFPVEFGDVRVAEAR